VSASQQPGQVIVDLNNDVGEGFGW